MFGDVQATTLCDAQNEKGALFSLQRIKVPSFVFVLEQQEFYFSCLVGMRMAQNSICLLRLVSSK